MSFYYRCPECKRERFDPRNAVMVVCPACMIEMVKIEERGDDKDN